MFCDVLCFVIVMFCDILCFVIVMFCDCDVL